MFLLQFLPSWLFTATLLISIVVYLVAANLTILPQAKLFKYGSILVVLLSIYMLGAEHDNAAWLQRVKELEAKIAKLEVKSAKTNTEIVTKIVTKRELIRERGSDIIQYVDKEIVKYDNTCKIPAEVVQAHNKAAR
jgi:hypothetical protein